MHVGLQFRLQHKCSHIGVSHTLETTRLVYNIMYYIFSSKAGLKYKPGLDLQDLKIKAQVKQCKSILNRSLVLNKNLCLKLWVAKKKLLFKNICICVLRWLRVYVTEWLSYKCSSLLQMFHMWRTVSVSWPLWAGVRGYQWRRSGPNLAHPRYSTYLLLYSPVSSALSWDV